MNVGGNGGFGNDFWFNSWCGMGNFSYSDCDIAGVYFYDVDGGLHLNGA